MIPTPISRTVKIRAASGFLAMALVGWSLTGSEPPPPTAAGAAPAATRAERAARPSRLTGPSAIAARRVAAIRAEGTPEDRLRATIDLASALPPSEFAAWLDGGWFTLRGGAELTIFTRILQERWAAEDPEGLLARSFKVKTENAPAILTSLAEKDPQRVLDFFKQQAGEDGSIRALAGIAGTHPDLALRCLREMAGTPISQNDLGIVSALLGTIARKSPATVEAALASLPPAMRTRAEMALCDQRLATSFSTEIRALWDRPDGLKIFSRQDRDTASKIFDELANLPPAWRASIATNPSNVINEANAGKWLATDLTAFGFGAAQQKHIRQQALAELADKQPELAVRSMAGMELEPHQRKSIISNLISSARGDAEKMEAVIAMLDTDADRNAGREMATAYRDAAQEKKIETPAAWLAKIAGGNPEQSGYRMISMLENWDPEKISGLNSQFASMPAGEKQKVAQALLRMGQSFSSGTTPVSGTAIRYLLENPLALEDSQQRGNADPIQGAAQYAVQMAVRDPIAASEWVASLPPGEGRLWAQKNVEINWRQHDPKAAELWLKTLPPADREAMEKLK